VQLILAIAFTHIVGRGRQTMVAVIGVAVGVGFSIAMAALMQGGQDDFVEQLINTMPHVQITDERRTPPAQPELAAFDAVAIAGLRPRDDRRGIMAPHDAVSNVDEEIEALIRRRLAVRHPDHAVLGEEGGLGGAAGATSARARVCTTTTRGL
jgi:ABC-type lipoprotein release transport system permease subunit